MIAGVLEAVQSNRLSEAELDRSIVRNVSLSLLGAELAERDVRIDRDAHHALAQRAAGQCVVLLKNDARALPLRRDARIAVIGAFAKQPRYQGAGSSQVTPTRLDCAFDAIAAIVDGAAALSYAPGYDPEHSEPDAGLIAEAVAAAESAEAAVLFAGLPGIYESEGFDRQHMRLPRQHDQLIAAVCRANGKTVVVLCNGAPVAMPWIDAPRAVLEGYLAGQAGGTAIAEVLFGLVNPSGKLAETFPLQQTDVPADHWFPGQGRQVLYREGLYVGYRYFDSAAAPVLFPFRAWPELHALRVCESEAFKRHLRPGRRTANCARCHQQRCAHRSRGGATLRAPGRVNPLQTGAGTARLRQVGHRARCNARSDPRAR